LSGLLQPDRLFDMLNDTPIYKKMDSSIFGITSVIKDYTNKKGDTFKVHFTINGKYIKKSNGDKPISYMGYFKVSKKAFNIDMKKLEQFKLYETLNDEDYAELFIPKDTDDLPLNYLGNTGLIACGLL
jgi:hypothetical protein